jgi:lipopolysaccharide transport system ATP-binding protein
MPDYAIKVEKLGKSYSIRHQQDAYATLRDSLSRESKQAIRRLLRRDGDGVARKEDFWALRDVAFEVQPGERLGIIGRNGAGKTTLLKVLSRITEPTCGRVRLRGRVSSLLEVGTGFHPELTGRENIFLNGAILGMTRAEIRQKFDEIVAFAEVERFLDTPVKRYSSGMYVRLAFSVAAHLDPEILLVDEVLAVGDAAFQKKCLGRMGEVARGGRTILFVSHQMSQIRRLCDTSIWLDQGRIRASGPSADVVGAYEAAMRTPHQTPDATSDRGTVSARFVSWDLVERDGQPSNTLRNPGPVEIRFLADIQTHITAGLQGVALYDADRRLLWGTAMRDLSLGPGRYEFVYQLESLPVRPGAYSWLVSLFDAGRRLDFWDCMPEMLVATEPLSEAVDDWAGFLNLPCQTRICQGSPSDEER